MAGGDLSVELMDQIDTLADELEKVKNQRDEALEALKVARRQLAFQPHPITWSGAEDKRAALERIDATVSKITEGKSATAKPKVRCSEDGCHRTEDCGPFCRNRNER